MLIVDVVTNLVTALICGFIVTQATKERKTTAMRWIRAGVLVLGIGALGDAVSHSVWSSHAPFTTTAIEAILWSALSTIAVSSILRHRRLPSRSERLVTALAALSSSFGLVWLVALGSVVREGDVSATDRVTGTVMLCVIAIQLSVIVVALKHTEHGALPGFAAFADSAAETVLGGDPTRQLWVTH